MQDDILPDARAAVADGGNPVPTIRAEKSRAIESAVRAVQAGAGDYRLLTATGAMVRLRPDPDRKCIFALRYQKRLHLKLPRMKAPLVLPSLRPLSQISA